ncbi:MAG: ferredoxin family protein [Candidatus Hodarchaeota archaeon]
MAAQIIQEKCTGCGWCISVCPHQIIILEDTVKVTIINEEKCIECGACALQCPSQAILAHPIGCGCATGVLKTKLRKLFRRNIESSCCQ